MKDMTARDCSPAGVQTLVLSWCRWRGPAAGHVGAVASTPSIYYTPHPGSPVVRGTPVDAWYTHIVNAAWKTRR